MRPARIFFLVVFLAAAAFLYWVTPFSADNGLNDYQVTPWLGNQIRFAFPFVGLLAVMAALGADRMGIPDSVLAIITAVSVACGLGRGIVSHVTAALIGILAVAFTLCGLRGVRLSPPRWTLIGAMAIILMAGTLLAHRERERSVRAFYGPTIDSIENEVAETETIGYLLSRRSYLFYGRNLRRKVVYIPIGLSDRRRWLETIRGRGVDVIAVGPIEPNWETGQAMQWLNDPQGPFVKVSGDDVTRESLLYRLRTVP